MKIKIMIAALFAVQSAVAQEVFNFTTAKANITNNYVVFTLPAIDGKPTALIAVTPNEKNPHPIGVWYTGSNWSIFNEDKAPMPEGIAFSINTGKNIFLVKASGSGPVAIDLPELNNNAAAKFSVTQNWNPGGGNGVYNPSNVAAAYDKATGRWVISNTDGSAIPAGAAFNIAVVNTDKAVIKPVNIPVVTNINEKIFQYANANLGFESGLSQWTATGDAFKNQPIQGNTVTTDRALPRMSYASGGIGGDYWKGLPYQIGVNGNGWIGTYENGNGDAPTGTLTSSSLRAERRYLTFLLGGGKDYNRLYVELQVKQADYEAAWGAGKKGLLGQTEDGFTRVNRITSNYNSEELFRYFFDLDAELNHQFAGKTIRIRIVDDKTNGWGHINVDDIKFNDGLSEYIALTRDGFGVYADRNKPVWGYFDSHAHPAADEAFGRHYYVGSSNTPLSTTWSNEVCTGSHTWGRTLDGFTNTFDPHKFFDGGWPDMLGFPKFNSKMHQKYQVDLIKRAWEGGLKIFCALGVNNMYIASRALGHGSTGAYDDESVLLAQTQVMKDMAAANSSWMAIAYSPTDARRIILEGKLCVILGVENDVFGNFKSPDCSWGDRSEDRPLVTITETNANAKLEAKLDEYYALGLRQILPMHYLSKPFGGTAVFNGNTFLPQITFYDHVRVKTGVPDRIGFSLYEDFPVGAGFVGNAITYAGYTARIQKQDEGTEISMVNADGLTPIGNLLFKKLMRKGFIVDQEHASYQSKRDILTIARNNGGYPVMASHCGPEGLSFIWTGAPVRFKDDKLRNFNTSTIRFVSHEMELNDETMSGIKDTKGTIGVFTLLNHKRKYTGSWGDIANDCPGSSKSVAQMYCYTLDKMNGHGVGFGSDMAMVDAVCPRFGPYSAWALTTEDDGSLKETQRTTDRMAQRNGVKYDVPSKSYYHEFFQGGQIDGFEEDVWKALAAWEAGANAVANESTVAESGDVLHRGRIRNMVKGLIYAQQNQLSQPCITCGETFAEQAAMFCLKNNLQPEALSVYDAGAKRDIGNMYNKILPAWNLWTAKTGTNEPLRRHITGNRYWDYNLDGLAHYGLLPDMLQDLKNVGFTQLQLVPLFGSAEDYIQMWERADQVKSGVRE